jgi:ADP-heptose:LPS heptosyltransferase
MEKLLLIRLNGLGDLICALPLYRSLERKYPGLRIDWVLSDINVCLFPFINPDGKVHQVASRGFRYFVNPFTATEIFNERYDVSIAVKPNLDSKFALLSFISRAKKRYGVIEKKNEISFWGNVFNRPVTAPEGSLHQVYKSLALAGDLLTPEDYLLDCSLEVFPHDLDTAQFLLRKDGIKSTDRFVVFQLSSTKRDTCRWPDENFIALARRFEEEGYRVILNAMPKDRAHAESISKRIGAHVLIYSSKNMGEYLALLSLAHLVVGADGGGIHLAGAVGTKTVAFYSESHPDKWGAFAGDHLRFYTAGEPLSTLPVEKVWDEIKAKNWL